MSRGPTCVVVGAGLAGLSTAVRLSDAGYRVHVIEASDVVGGRTADWVDEGMRVETGLHRYLGFYRHLPRLLEHIGVPLRDVVTWTDSVSFSQAGGPDARFWASPLRHPCGTLHTALTQSDFLPWSQRVALLRMVSAGAIAYYRHPDRLDAVSLASWARRHRVSDETIDRLLGPLTAGLFFIPPTRFSAHSFMGVLMPYLPTLLKTGVGAFSGGMTEVMTGRLAAYIRGHGGVVSTGVRARALAGTSERIRGVITDRGEADVDEVVVATSLGPAKSLVDSALAEHPYFDGMRALPSTPAVTFQAETTHPVLPTDAPLFAPGTAIGCLAEQSRTTFKGSAGRISVIMANPHEVRDLTTAELADLVTDEAARVGVYLEGQILNARTVHIDDDFYDMGVGHERLRPPQHTPIPGLTLAGDYTRQKYLATMEGAVYSGSLAAKSILERAA